jgi:hypothetical protein
MFYTCCVTGRVTAIESSFFYRYHVTKNVTKVLTGAMLQKGVTAIFWPVLYENRGHHSSDRCCTVGDTVFNTYCVTERVTAILIGTV